LLSFFCLNILRPGFFHILKYRVVDPNWFNPDPDPAFLLNPDTNPDPTLIFCECKFSSFCPSKIVSTKFRSFNAILGWNGGHFKETFSARLKRNIGVRCYLATLTVWWEASARGGGGGSGSGFWIRNQKST
jgi:hypothetical protein